MGKRGTCPNHRKFSDGLEITICRRLQSLSQLSTPLYSQLILRIYAAMNGLGGSAKTEVAPGAGNPRYATGYMYYH